MTENAKVNGISAKIGSAFILQAAAIACAAILGVYASAMVLQDVLIRRALNEEALHYLQLVATDASTPPPHTHNMRGYFIPVGAPGSDVPDELRGFGPGLHALSGKHRGTVLRVQDGPTGRLYLAFDRAHVNRLALYYGIAPLALVLLAIYLATFLTYRVSRRAISPVVWLAAQVRDLGNGVDAAERFAAERIPPEADDEVRALADALKGYAERTMRFVERERAFTRDASHELRTPLTVIRVSAETLESDEDTPGFCLKPLKRINKAARDMESLIEAFLILARESEAGLPVEEFSVNQVVREELERCEPLVEDRPIQLEFIQHQCLVLKSSPRALGIVVGNLLRNACLYTDHGRVEAIVEGHCVRIRDTGRGMSKNEVEQVFKPFFRGGDQAQGGYGVGLAIVKRLTQRYGWMVEIDSELGVGTCFTLHLASAREHVETELVASA